MFHNGVGETEDMGTRPLAHAGRRSAGLGGDGRALADSNFCQCL